MDSGSGPRSVCSPDAGLFRVTLPELLWLLPATTIPPPSRNRPADSTGRHSAAAISTAPAKPTNAERLRRDNAHYQNEPQLPHRIAHLSYVYAAL
jgi:hypothetical protein